MPRIGAPAREDPAHVLARELLGVALHHPPPAVAEAEDGRRALRIGVTDDGADGGVQARAVPASGQQPQAHAAASAIVVLMRGTLSSAPGDGTPLR